MRELCIGTTWECHIARSPGTRVLPSEGGHAASGHPLPYVLQKTDRSNPRLIFHLFFFSPITYVNAIFYLETLGIEYKLKESRVFTVLP
jgi:hypothetical protein